MFFHTLHTLSIYWQAFEYPLVIQERFCIPETYSLPFLGDKIHLDIIMTKAFWIRKKTLVFVKVRMKNPSVLPDWNELRYYDTADMLIYLNSAGKPSMWPTSWVCPGLANLFEGGLKPNCCGVALWYELKNRLWYSQINTNSGMRHPRVYRGSI